MATDSTTRCPHCDALVSIGAVCEECGAELGATPVPPPAGLDTAVSSSTTAFDSADDAADHAEHLQQQAAAVAHPLQDLEALLNETTATSERIIQEVPTVQSFAAPIPAEADAADEEDDLTEDCPHFRMEFNSARIFLTHWVSTFNFRLHPCAADLAQLRDVVVEIKLHNSAPLTQRVLVLHRRSPTEVNFTFTPRDCGYDISAEVFLRYNFAGRKQTFCGLFKWDCMSPETPSSKVIENLVINMEDVGAEMAAEQNINILKDFRSGTPESLRSRLRQLKLQPVWQHVRLFDVNSADLPPAGAAVKRLTLLGPDFNRIHLIAQKTVTLGRSRAADNDTHICLRAFDADGDMNKALSHFISRFHLRLTRSEHGYILQDGGPSSSQADAPIKPSSAGTCIDGQPLAKLGTAPLVAGRAIEINLGKPGSFLFNEMGLRATVRSDTRTGDPACLILRRTDAVPEVFVLLARSCPLDLLVDGHPVGKIRRRHDAFQIDTSDEDAWLQPGQAVPFLRGWRAVAFQQFGID